MEAVRFREPKGIEGRVYADAPDSGPAIGEFMAKSVKHIPARSC